MQNYFGHGIVLISTKIKLQNNSWVTQADSARFNSSCCVILFFAERVHLKKYSWTYVSSVQWHTSHCKMHPCKRTNHWHFIVRCARATDPITNNWVWLVTDFSHNETSEQQRKWLFYKAITKIHAIFFEWWQHHCCLAKRTQHLETWNENVPENTLPSLPPWEVPGKTPWSN